MESLNLRGSHCVVTGGFGFIGSNLAKRLQVLGARVTLIDNFAASSGANSYNISSGGGQFTQIHADIGESGAVREAVSDANIIYNLAGHAGHAESMTDPIADLRTNVESQLEFLRICMEKAPGARIVFASTRQIYGRPESLPVGENHPLNPVDINGIHKIAGESYHRLFSQLYDLPSTVLRLTNTYGPRMRVRDSKQTFIGVWIKNVIERKPITIFGDGSQLRDFTFVEDAVDAFILAGTNPDSVGKTYNLGGVGHQSLTEVAKLLVELRPESKLEYVPFPDNRRVIDVGNYYANDKAIRQDLGWAPSVPLSAGLEKTLSFFESHAGKYGIQK